MEKAPLISLYWEFWGFLSALLKPSRVLNARTPSGAQLWCYHIVPAEKPDQWSVLISFQLIKDVLQFGVHKCNCGNCVCFQENSLHPCQAQREKPAFKLLATNSLHVLAMLLLGPAKSVRNDQSVPCIPNQDVSLIHFLGFPHPQWHHTGLSWAAGCLSSLCQPSKVQSTNWEVNSSLCSRAWPHNCCPNFGEMLWVQVAGWGWVLLLLTVLKVLIFLQCSAPCWIHFLPVPCPCLGFIDVIFWNPAAAVTLWHTVQTLSPSQTTLLLQWGDLCTASDCCKFPRAESQPVSLSNFIPLKKFCQQLLPIPLILCFTILKPPVLSTLLKMWPVFLLECWQLLSHSCVELLSLLRTTCSFQ